MFQNQNNVFLLMEHPSPTRPYGIKQLNTYKQHQMNFQISFKADFSNKLLKFHSQHPKIYELAQFSRRATPLQN